MRKLLCALILVSVQLACELSSELKVYPQHSAAATPPAQVVEMIVVADSLNVRASHTEQSESYYIIYHGETVTVYRVLLVGESNWCWISPPGERVEWVNCRWLGAAE